VFVLIERKFEPVGRVVFSLGWCFIFVCVGCFVSFNFVFYFLLVLVCNLVCVFF